MQLADDFISLLGMRAPNKAHGGIGKRIVTVVELASASSLDFRPSSAGDVNYDQTHPPIDSRIRDLSRCAHVLVRLIKG